MPRRWVVGVMGRGEGASVRDVGLAEDLGERIARQGWILLTGGRDAGVMAAANRGAKRVAGGLTVGVLPSRRDTGVCEDLDIAIFTGMGDARNAINVLSSDVVVVCGQGGAGTTSEAALALKAKRPLVLLAPSAEAEAFFVKLDASVVVAESPERVVSWIAERGPRRV